MFLDDKEYTLRAELVMALTVIFMGCVIVFLAQTQPAQQCPASDYTNETAKKFDRPKTSVKGFKSASAGSRGVRDEPKSLKPETSKGYKAVEQAQNKKLVATDMVLHTNKQPQVVKLASGNMEDPELQLDSSNGLGYLVSQVNTYTSNTLPSKNTDAQAFMMLSWKKVGGSPVLYFNKHGYDRNTVKIKQTILANLYKSLNASTVNDADQNRIDNWIQGIDQANSTIVKSFSSDTNPDLVGASNFLGPIKGPMGTIIGVLCIVIGMGIAFSVVWDLAFLNVPIIETMLTKNRSGADLDLHNKPFLVSQDAVMAYNESNNSNYDQPVNGVFLKRRIKSLVIVGLCLTYLVSNQIWNLVGFIVDFVGRIINS